MPAAITCKEFRNHIQMEVNGTGTAEYVLSECQKVWKRLSILCSTSGKRKALLLVHLRNRIHIGQSMDMARLAEENGWTRQYRLAIVSDPDNRMTMDLMKSFLIHRGFEAQVFDTPRSARKWLASSE